MHEVPLFPSARKPAVLDRWQQAEAGARRKVLDSHAIRIAISGKSGCGNSTLCSILAARYKVRRINYTFRNLALDYNIPLSKIARRAEYDRSIDWHIDSKLYGLFTSGGGILGSRLAVWLGAAGAFTVYLRASLEVRAQRIAQREERDYAEVYAETRHRDAMDEQRYLDWYAIDINDYSFVDSICDCEQHSPEVLAEMIVDTYHELLYG